jgi:hypothetical protein
MSPTVLPEGHTIHTKTLPSVTEAGPAAVSDPSTPLSDPSGPSARLDQSLFPVAHDIRLSAWQCTYQGTDFKVGVNDNCF